MNASGNLIDTLLNYNNGAVIKQVAQQFGIPEETAAGAVQSLVPALSRGIERNISQGDGLSSLLGALQTGDHERYVQDPQVLDQPQSIEDGNAILGHVLGSKDVSRNVAGFASNQTGLDPALLKQMLPVLASTVMGMLSSRVQGGGAATAAGGQGGGQAASMMGMLNGFLDADKDGSALDDVLNMAQRFFSR